MKYAWGMAAVLSVDFVTQLAAGAVHAFMAEYMLWIEDMATGVWVADIAKELGVTINYSSLPCHPRTCRATDAVTSSFNTAEAMHCAHQHNGQCCGTCSQQSSPCLASNYTQTEESKR